MSATTPIGQDDIEAAAERTRGHVRRTPTMAIDAGDVGLAAFGLGALDLHLKLELLQVSGSFKARGATNKARASDLPASGLIAASGGNHGLAVATAARSLGVPAEIFVPSISSPVKQARLADLGATVHVGGANYQDAQDACSVRAAESGALQIHPYEDPLVMAGQGTVGREIDEQIDGVDTVLIAVGGGGLAAGIAAWFGDRARIVVVEPETSQCYAAAARAGEPTPVSVSGVAADSLGASQIGSGPFAVLWQAGLADLSVTVTDEQIITAQRTLWSEFHLAAEPGGATALAALQSGAYEPDPSDRVAVVVCGSNVDPTTLT